MLEYFWGPSYWQSFIYDETNGCLQPCGIYLTLSNDDQRVRTLFSPRLVIYCTRRSWSNFACELSRSEMFYSLKKFKFMFICVYVGESFFCSCRGLLLFSEAPRSPLLAIHSSCDRWNAGLLRYSIALYSISLLCINIYLYNFPESGLPRRRRGHKIDNDIKYVLEPGREPITSSMLWQPGAK